MNFEKLQQVYYRIIFIILFIGTQSVSAQYFISGPTSVSEGSYEYYNITNMYGQSPSSGSYFTWNSTIGSLDGSDGYGMSSMAMSFDSPGTGELSVSWSDDFTYQYYYVTTTIVVKKMYPDAPSDPTILSANCSNTTIQRGTPPAGVTWYWQSTASGTDTSDSNATKTIANGVTYYLRARDNSSQIWSIYPSSITTTGNSAPIIGTVTQPTLSTSTGSVELSGLPSGNWTINPGNISGTGNTTTVTGLAAATTYNFTITNSLGCTSPTSANVVINAQPSGVPSPSLSAVTQPTCTNNTGSFTITNYNSGYSYSASPSTGVSFSGSTVIAPTGTYIITVTIGNNTASSSAVTINAQPAAPASPLIDTITQPTASVSTGSVVLMGLPVGNWIINPGNITGSGTSRIISGLMASTTYNFTVTNSIGCSSAPATVVINAQPSISTCNSLSNENYVQKINPQVAVSDLSGLANTEKIESITYIDGLGRPMQNIAVRAGGKNEDIVTHIGYDNFDRQDKEYLPYTDGGNCGLFRTGDIAVATKSYYSTTEHENTINPYSEKEFDASPLNRVTKQAAPGNDWKLNNGHEIKMEYKSNISTDQVKHFEVSFVSGNTENPQLENKGPYASAKLYKTITKDENWQAGQTSLNDHTTEEFKNKDGQVVLKRTYNNGLPHDTYYVYDVYGNLTYVIPPKAVDLINSSTSQDVDITSRAVVSSGQTLNLTASNSITLAADPNDPSKGFHAMAGSTFSAVIDKNKEVLDHLCYQYKYDSRNRLIEKKLPGKGYEYIVYDKLDRPILTQDANLRTANKWMFTKYDVFGRTIYTGEYVNTTETSRISVQGLANANSILFENKQDIPMLIDTTNVNYSNNAFPTVGTNLLTINYYDNYTGIDLDGGTAVASYGVTPITNAKGLSTCSKVRTLGTSLWTTAVTYYDEKGRVIYTYSNNNFLSSVSTAKSDLDFTGKARETTSTHKKGTSDLVTIIDTFTYDHTGRLISQKQKINNQAQETIVFNTYDDLGQLITKEVGGTSSSLQTVNFKYNIRGWLKNINDVNALGNDLFAFQIKYNDIVDVSKKLYNGNISQTLWKTANSDSSLKNYTYTYDNLNRLTNAVDNLGKFNESLSYDKNGNITQLTRLGEIVGGNTVPDINTASHFGIMDNLTYTYDMGNQLQIVSDSADDTYGFKDDMIGSADDTTTDYTYDDNGNMKTDTNKGITNIDYNHLNLPVKIAFAAGSIEYTYDATGVKLEKKVTETNKPDTFTKYVGSFIYEKLGNNSDVLKFFSQPEGYVSYNSGTFDYIYQYKDHLGNVRLSYDKNLAIQEENNYYPFGLKHKGYNYLNNVSTGNSYGQKYKFQGKELQDELGLGLYDFELRQYEPTIGRMLQIDPVTHHNQSPYTAFDNNPVFWTDPDGADTRDPVKDRVSVISSYVDKSNVTHITETITNTTTTYGDDGSVNVSYSTSSITNTVDADGNVSKGTTVSQSSGSISKDSDGNVSVNSGKSSTRDAKSGDGSSALNQWTNTVSNYNKSSDGIYNVDKINKTADYTITATKAGTAILGNFGGLNSVFSKLSSKQKDAIGVFGSYTSVGGLVGFYGNELKNKIGKNNHYAIIYGVQHVQNGAMIKEMKTPAGQAGGSRYSVGPTSWQGLWKAIKSLF